MLQKSVDEAMGELGRVGRRGGKGDTSGVTCTPDVKTDSACLKAVLDLHEAMHAKECTGQKKGRKLGPLDDRMKGMLLTDYAKEEIKGYQIEIDEIVKRLRAMPASCRPSGWVGTIHALEAKHMKSTLVTPRQAQYDTDKTRTMDDWRARRGAIFHDGKTSSAYWHIEHTATHTDTSGSLVGCFGGAKPMPPDRSETTTSVNETSGTGFSKEVPEVGIDVTVDGLYYELSFACPRSASSQACRSRREPAAARTSAMRSRLRRPRRTFARSDWLTFKGRVDPKARYIGGSDTEDLNKNAPRSRAWRRTSTRSRSTGTCIGSIDEEADDGATHAASRRDRAAGDRARAGAVPLRRRQRPHQPHQRDARGDRQVPG